MSRQRTLTGLATLLLASTIGQAAELHATIKDQHGKPLADAVIVATPVDAKAMLHAKGHAGVVDQVDKQFVPYVTAIRTGSTIRFPNKDNIRHQVYSFSPAKKFELPLYAGLDAPPVVFNTSGVVVLGCNIHDWMLAYIYVTNTPFFSQTATSGAAVLAELPSGEYTVRIWHPEMELDEESTTKRVTLATNDALALEWRLAIKSRPRISRASGDAGAGYP